MKDVPSPGRRWRRFRERCSWSGLRFGPPVPVQWRVKRQETRDKRVRSITGEVKDNYEVMEQRLGQQRMVSMVRSYRKGTSELGDIV